MILLVYRSQRAIFQRPRLLVRWDEWSFSPCYYASWDGTDSCVHTRGESITVPVHAPVGSRLIQRGGADRLATYFDDWGIEAASVAYLAAAKMNCFRLEQKPMVIADQTDGAT